ncbi:MAG: alpha/beta family hydrolase [Bdellovibrionota bacterium]
MGIKFLNRKRAGILLGERLRELTLKDPLILALPRGGVPVAFEVAKALGAPLEVLIVRRVGAPGHKEFGIGAVTENNHYWIDPRSVHYTGAHAVDVEKSIEEERKEVQRRIQLYRENRPLPDLHGRSVVVVDDGLATGVTARVACSFLKQEGAEEVILAVPVCAPATASLVRAEVDQLVCLDEPETFFSVEQYYEDYRQLQDSEIVNLLWKSRMENEQGLVGREVTITGDGTELKGFLAVPNQAEGIVLFAHGSGSSRASPRNLAVARALQAAGIGTLLFDLLSIKEAGERRNVFDIVLLGKRLLTATQWVQNQKECEHLPIGFFGASTGAGAALWAAAELGDAVSAVVSRGGRPDLAGDHLEEVTAPTLLLVGAHDEPVIEMNQRAQLKLRNVQFEIISGATHLFEEPGTLEQVEKKAAAWFLANFARSRRMKAA